MASDDSLEEPASAIPDETEAEERGSLTRSTVQGVFWITAGRLARAPLSLIAVAVLARLLTPSDFGVVTLGMITVTVSNVLVDGSFGMVLIQRKKIDAALIGASLALSSALAILLSIIIIATAPYVQQQFEFPKLEEVLLVAGAVLPVTAVTMVTSALLQRSFRFATLTFIQLASQVAYTAVGVGLAFAGAGMWALVWAQVTSFVFEALAGFLAVRKQYRLAISSAAVRDVFTFGGMFTVSKLLNWAANNADRIIVGRMFGAADLGFYTRAALLMKTAKDASGAGPTRVLFSSFAKLQHDHPRMSRAYLRALSVTVVISGLVTTFVMVNSRLIVDILLGQQWLSTVLLLQILFSAFVARSAYAVAEAVPLALGLSGQSAFRQAAQLILVIIGAALGSRYGMVGATIGVTAAYWLFYFLCLLLVQRLIQPGWFEIFRVHAKGVFASLIPAIPALAVQFAVPEDNLLLQFIPAIVFGLGAAGLLAFGPASLITDDIVKARNHVLTRILPRLRLSRAGG